MTLTEFLLARIAEDEERARACILAMHGATGEWVTYDGHDWLVPHVVYARQGVLGSGLAQVCSTEMAWTGQRGRDHIAAWDPKRVLAECEAKRRIVAEVTSGPMSRVGDGRTLSPWSMHMLGLLALPYADHPSYDEGWRP